MADREIRGHERRVSSRNIGRNQNQATRTQRQKTQRRRKKRAVRLRKENVRRANRPTLWRSSAVDRQNHRSDGNTAGGHASIGGGGSESRSGGVQGGSAANVSSG